jgi:HD-like signal output (HDOD) protein
MSATVPFVAPSALAALDPARLSALVKDIGIPPRPDLLERLHVELSSERPRLDALVQVATSDVAVSAALVKIANAPWLGLPRPIGTVRLAFERLGACRCTAILSALVLKRVLPCKGPSLDRFWDVAQRRSIAMGWLARRHGLVEPDLAHSFGLFCDIGIPVLMQRFEQPSYRVTLAEANLGHRPFTEVEQARHGTDHALVGASMAGNWGLSEEIVQAVALHHDYRIFGRADVSRRVQVLVALALVAERVIQRHQGLNRHAEWRRGGLPALVALELTPHQFEVWADEVQAQLELCF